MRPRTTCDEAVARRYGQTRTSQVVNGDPRVNDSDGGDANDSDVVLTTGLQEIPDIPGVYTVATISGTVHLISTLGRLKWMRLPTPTSDSAVYDGKCVILSEMADFVVGRCGRLTVSDSSYLYGSTTHLTARIIRITVEPGSTQLAKGK